MTQARSMLRAWGSGQGGIRTHDDPKAILVFETSAFNRSATCPRAGILHQGTRGFGKGQYATLP